jgi:CubicO group peptidase (beta-lactamase class C family)
MKKYVFLLLQQCCVIIVSAQLSGGEFRSLAIQQDSIRKLHWNNAQYDKAREAIRKTLEAYNTLNNRQTKALYKNSLISGYYNMACAYSLERKQDSALHYINLMVANGFNNYKNLMADTDFDAIKESGKFKELTNRLREENDYNFIRKKYPDFTIPEILIKLAEPVIVTRIKDSINAGFAIGVIDGDKSSMAFYGLKSLETKEKVDKNTLFEIGSVTKTFTALLLADLVVNKELSLADSVRKFLPGTVAKNMGPVGGIKLISLATQRSGLPRNLVGSSGDYIQEIAKGTMGQFYDSLKKIDPRTNAGNKMYSNAGFELLGHILELKSGQTYETLLQNRICNPIGMPNTHVHITEKDKSSAATGYANNTNSGVMLQPASYFYNNFSPSSGSIVSTLPDMMKYLDVLLYPEKNKNLSAAINLCLKAYGGDPYMRQNANALAWGRLYDADIMNIVFDHDGGTQGFSAWVMFSADLHRGIVLLSNTNFGEYYNEFRRIAYQLLHNK